MTLLFIALTALYMLAPELLKNDTKKEIQDDILWLRILSMSTCIGIMIGNISTFFTDEIFWVILITAFTYVSVQSIYTDFMVKKVNRNMLRFAYVLTNSIGIYLIITRDFNLISTIGFFIIIILSICGILFVDDKIFGASDGRALLMVMPISFLLFGHISLYLLVFILLCLHLFQRKTHKSIPMVPFFTAPYTLLFLISLIIGS